MTLIGQTYKTSFPGSRDCRFESGLPNFTHKKSNSNSLLSILEFNKAKIKKKEKEEKDREETFNQVNNYYEREVY